MNCERAQRSLPLLIADDLDAEERRILERHLGECARCDAIRLEEMRLRDLLALWPGVEPGGELLRGCRDDLSAALAGGAMPGRETPHAWPARLSPVLAACLVAAGFLAGWLIFGSGLATVRQMAGSAVLGTSAEAAQASVSSLVAEPGSDRVRLRYEMLTRRSLDGTSADPEIRRLLTGTLRDSPNAGLRLDAIDALRSRVEDPEVRQALLGALRDDRNVGARLKALDALQGVAAGDAEVRAAVLQTLQADDNAGVRVRAVDLLQRERDPHTLAVFERLSREDPNDYVRLRSAAALDDPLPASSGAR